MEYIVGVDIGGTFTDCVTMDSDGNVTVGKAPSTPEDYSNGALNALRNAAENLGLSEERDLLSQTRLFFHSCTIGDNALITRSGAKTGLITTMGFADTLLIMRGRTTDGLIESEVFHVSAQQKPQPFIPRWLTEEVNERIDYKGSILVHLDTAQAERAIDKLAAAGVESIALSLLWAISNNAHERAVADLVRRKYPSIFLSLSSEVAPYFGEYERTATVAFNAYIGPKISVYLQRLESVLREKGLRREPLIMQSYGGVLGVEATSKNAVGTIESGPAAGIVGSHYMGRLMGLPDILATDMGGTTFKVSVIRDGVIEKDYRPILLRYQIYSTKIWVESIGAGGGSIAWIEPETALLKVGPQGAGAKPGPVCYGLGGVEPTVSDADLILGYLNESYFLGGRMPLDRARATEVMETQIARPLDMTVAEAAAGIFKIINAHMSDLIRRATVERGCDPRDFTLFAFGGAAPVHAGRYAAELGITQIVVPLTASVHSATGLVSSDIIYEYGKSDRMIVPGDVERINRNFAELIERAVGELASAGFTRDKILISRSLDMRYRYQVHELNVGVSPGTTQLSREEIDESYARFDVLYEQTYGQGSGYREAGKEVINFRVTAMGELDKPNLKQYSLVKSDPRSALKGERDVFFEEFREFVSTDVYDFGRLQPGAEIPGPAIIESPVTTVVVNPQDRALMDGFQNIRLFIGH